MDEDTEKLIDTLEKQTRESKIQTQANQVVAARTEQDLIMDEQDKGMIGEQLDLGDVLEKMHHLLKGDVLRKVDGGTKWVAADDKSMTILSEHGINYVMGIIQWYLNKNTLLSNYDDAQIREKMEDFSNTINDGIFMEYDKMFCYPTLEDCKKELRARITTKREIRKFALELMGKKVDGREIHKQILAEMEGRIERELETIKQQTIKDKLKRFESLIRCIQDTVHSAYQRAWKGQERETLRRHTHISETKGGGMVMPPQQSGFNPWPTLRRKP